MRAVSVAIVFGLAALGAEAADEGAHSQITVEGQAEVRVSPDRVHLAIVAEQRGAALAPAEAAVKASTEAAVRLLHEHGVADADIDSSDYAVEPVNEWTDGRKLGKRLGFHVRRTLQVTLRDLPRFGSLLARLAEEGSLAVGGVEPESEKTRGQRDEARLLAVRAAREKAQAIVAELGQTLGRATIIEVDGASASACGSLGAREQALLSNAGANLVASNTAGPLYSLGAITLSARVKITFELK